MRILDDAEFQEKLARLTRPRSRRQGAAAVPPSSLGGVPPGLDTAFACGQGGGGAGFPPGLDP